MAAEFETLMADALRDGIIPGAVVSIKDKSGNVNYTKAFYNDDGLYKDNAVITIASLTKLVTAVAALQLVEKGLISLDDEVSHHIPSFASQEVLDSLDEEGNPQTHKRRNDITLRQLLTHSAGAGYPFSDERIGKMLSTKGDPPAEVAGTIDGMFNFPLSYEPGEGFLYSSSFDRVGQIIEKLSGKTLEAYFKEFIFGPVGVTTGTFWSDSYTPMSVRPGPDAALKTDASNWNFAAGWKECSGGQGLYMSVEDYSKILHSLLTDDGKLLSSKASEGLFQPNLSAASKAVLLKRMENPAWLIGDFSGPLEYDWSLCGLVVDGDKHPRRKKGTAMWSAASNCFWFIDRETGVCGVFGTQVLPPADPVVQPLIDAFEKEAYKMVKAG